MWNQCRGETFDVDKEGYFPWLNSILSSQRNNRQGVNELAWFMKDEMDSHENHSRMGVTLRHSSATLFTTMDNIASFMWNSNLLSNNCSQQEYSLRASFVNHVWAVLSFTHTYMYLLSKLRGLYQINLVYFLFFQFCCCLSWVFFCEGCYFKGGVHYFQSGYFVWVWPVQSWSSLGPVLVQSWFSLGPV